MNPDRLADIEELFDAALRRPPDERASWVASACRDEPGLAAAVMELLAAHDGAIPYFDELGSRAGSARLLELELAARASRRIGPYELLRPLGRGGMGTVFLAVRADGQFDQQVALKLLPVGIGDEVAVRRFVVERQIVARLSHQHIARLLDGGVADDQRPYFVMELVDGSPITDWCLAHRASIGDRLRLFSQVIDAVQYAHRNLVIHRDLKPSNILVTPEGQVKLLDFGIARIVGESTEVTADRALSPAYAAPEQLNGLPVSTAADVFSLGVVLFELLAGERPFRGTTLAEVTHAILETEPPRPSMAAALREDARQLRGDLDRICLMALHKDPDRRYRSVEQFGEDIRRHLAGMPVIARPDSRAYRIRKFVGRHQVAVGLATAALTLLVTFTAVLAVQAQRIASERNKAEQVADLLVGVFEVSDPTEARGVTLTAREVLDRGTARVDEELAGQPEVQADLLAVLARVHQNLGLYGDAAALLEKSLALTTQLGRGATADAAASLARLGEVQRQSGRYPQAEKTLREALALYAATTPGDHAAIAVTNNHLGKVLLAAGRLDDAAMVMRQGLEHAQRNPPVLTEVAEAHNNLGGLAFTRGEFDAAEGHFREALEIRRRVLGPDHPTVPATLNNLASLLSRKGDPAGADPLYRQALDIYRRILDRDDARIATTLNNLGLSLLARRDYDAAEPLFRESLAMRRHKLPPQHPDLAQSLANLGLLLQREDRLDEAVLAYTEALEIRRAALGPAHPLLAQSMHNLGLLRHAQGDAAGGDRWLRDALAIQQRALPPDHPDLKATRAALAARAP